MNNGVDQPGYPYSSILVFVIYMYVSSQKFITFLLVAVIEKDGVLRDVGDWRRGNRAERIS